MHHRFLCTGSLVVWFVLLGSSMGEAKEPVAKKTAQATAEVELAEGALAVTTPATWKKVKPRNRIIEIELAVPGKPADDGAAETKPPTARLTMMAAGGSVDQNLARWIGQFQGTAAGAAREKAKIDRREVAGMPLHTLDIAGTYMDAPRGPFGPKEAKPNHRMLAGILETKREGKYFFKLIGPQEVVEHNAKAFAAMLDSVEVK